MINLDQLCRTVGALRSLVLPIRRVSDQRWPRLAQLFASLRTTMRHCPAEATQVVIRTVFGAR